MAIKVINYYNRINNIFRDETYKESNMFCLSAFSAFLYNHVGRITFPVRTAEQSAIYEVR